MRKQSERGAVLLVTDRPTQSETSSVAQELGADAVFLSDLAASRLDGDPSLIVDVDLRDVDIVRQLKAALPPRGAGCRIFLIDTDNRVTSVHANVLGANHLLSKKATVAQMHAALDKHFGISAHVPQDEAVLASICSGVQALDNSFQAMANKIELDNAGVIAACEKIADAVCVDGVCDWLSAVRSHHVGTFQHCMLVTGVVAAFATKTNMPREEVVRMTVAGLLHDIGKSNVPVSILDKPGALTLREMDAIRVHPVAGYNYLVDNSTMDAEILSSVRGHHEYLDGTGYPDNLTASDINEMTRIITVCDVYAALIERRSYKEPKTHAEAVAILHSMAAAGKVEARLVRELDWIMAPGED